MKYLFTIILFTLFTIGCDNPVETVETTEITDTITIYNTDTVVETSTITDTITDTFMVIDTVIIEPDTTPTPADWIQGYYVFKGSTISYTLTVFSDQIIYSSISLGYTNFVQYGTYELVDYEVKITWVRSVGFYPNQITDTPMNLDATAAYHRTTNSITLDNKEYRKDV